jgi:phage baseplate assembly protein W
MWKDLDILLRKQQDGDLKVMTDEDAVVNSLSNIFGTMQGQRRMLPEFALPFFNILFEPIDEQTAYLIGNEMLNAIQLWEDRIEVLNVNVYPDEDNLQYVVTLTFKLRTSTSEPQTYTTILKQQG